MFSFLRSIALPLPTFGIALPANIQRRLLSFVLKYFLGHLVKPGQLDDHKIDAQIGSGRVEIKDVELDDSAINKLLVGLPVSLRGGTLGNVSVQVPWPNVLAGSLSVSVSGVSLTLVLRPTPTSASTSATPIDLSSSVASMVAETFVHKDLSEAENNALRQSIHSEFPIADPTIDDDFAMPGSMDPFLETAIGGSMEESTVLGDEEGVGVLTAVVERLMARFTCSAKDISITLVHEGNASFHLCVSEFTYGDGVSNSNVTKEISLRGFSISVTPLEPTDPSSAIYSPIGSPGRQNSGEDGQESMQQSITSLASSVMFQSAMSIMQTAPASPTTSTRQELPCAQQILSLSEESLAVTIATRPRGVVPPGSGTNATRQRSPKFSVEAKMGYLACALRPIDVGSILRALTFVAPPTNRANDRPPPQQENKKGMPVFEGSGRIRGVVIVLLLEHARSPLISRQQLDTEMSEFFRQPHHSLSTPHFRARIDTIEPSFDAAGDLRAQVGEISLFHMQGGPNPSSSPLLIADPNLDAQYPINMNAPAFEIVDWTKSSLQAGPPKISAWRVRSLPGQKLKASGSTIAVTVRANKGGDIQVGILPLHVFLDLKTLEDAIAFSNGIGPTTSDDNEFELDDTTPPITPRGFRSVADDMERVEEKIRGVTISCPLIRVQLRTPSPGLKQRSGAIVIDLHTLKVDISTPLQVRWGRLLVALANDGDTRTTTILSVGPSRTSGPNVKPFGGLTPTQKAPNAAEPEVSQVIVRTGTPTTLEVQLPALYVLLSHFNFEGLQYWVDDATQWAERALGDRRLDQSRDPSLIGSRFFARNSSIGTVETAGAGKSQTIISVNLDRAEVQLFVPRQTSIGSTEVLPFEITAVGLEVILEMKPDGKDETRVSASILDLNVQNANGSPLASTIISRTHSLNLAGHAKPVVKVNFNAIVDPETGGRENRIKAVLTGITFTLSKTFAWVDDLTVFFKAPPETFEAVVPTERVRLNLSLLDSCAKLVAPKHPGALAVVIGAIHFNTDVIANSSETTSEAGLRSVTVLVAGEERPQGDEVSVTPSKVRFTSDVDIWKQRGFASLVVIDELATRIVARKESHPPLSVDATRVKVGVLACADTLGALASFGADLATMFPKPPHVEKPRIHTVQGTGVNKSPQGVLGDLEEYAFNHDHHESELGPTLDIIKDDVPKNPDYLDDSFGATGRLIALSDEEPSSESADEEEMSESIFEEGSAIIPPVHRSRVYETASYITAPEEDAQGYRGETIILLTKEGINIVEDYYENVEPEPPLATSVEEGLVAFSLNVQNCDVTIRLHDGYDWEKTRLAIEQGRKAVRRRLEKIRQLLASGQVPDESIEDTHAVLFNSIYVGLQQDLEDMEPEAMIAAIDQELADDGDTATVSSWQTFAGAQSTRSTPKRQSIKATNKKSRRLTRSRGPRIEILLKGLSASISQFGPNETTAMRALVTMKDLEILDHIKTSTWNAFLTSMAADSRGNVRETGSNMVRAEFCIVRPIANAAVEEGRLKAKILPIRLHVDQDALDFLKKFFMFKDPEAEVKPVDGKPVEEMFLQHVEIFPVDLKLDYKPKRVDYRALREGKTIELMNFFHFEGAEMTLRHITLSGITGWARLGDTLNDLWTPDVKATQLAEIVAGIAPFRSLVRVGAGMADLVLLPASAGWRRDRRREKAVRGAAAEAAALGARLANGAQVVLERAESMLGGGPAAGSGLTARPGPGVGAFRGPVTVVPAGGEWDGSASMLAPSVLGGDEEGYTDEEGSGDERMISRYAQQPRDVTEGVRSGAQALRRNATAAAQTILAIPMEVYEQTENEGPMRAVVRAVPIAVLRPMIGATEAVGQTLLGLRNSLDPHAAIDEGAKWKRR
ncbi:putative autophagy-related protein Atg2 [Rhizoctonia solani 123E]|uniref:Autophagy-related protein 2 n=1 Tax=Rhizoctonia solani 123E TaxID=1423351 RepID=A0A074RLU1_9AGAM|nr:putative autophagy-related protein Atg2 [Rhizoctonia solani 123E]